MQLTYVKQVDVIWNMSVGIWDNLTQLNIDKSSLTVCSYVTYAFQSESTLCSCLNVKELFARNKGDIWSLSDCNGSRTQFC